MSSLNQWESNIQSVEIFQCNFLPGMSSSCRCRGREDKHTQIWHQACSRFS